MNENIFKDAYFGKPYTTRNGNEALYHTLVNERPQCLVKGVGLKGYAFSGVSFDAGLEHYYKTGEFPEGVDTYELNEFSEIDIISEEEIGEEELMDLSCACYPCDNETDAHSFHKGFKSGYKAKENYENSII